jgi:hypothetical protein
LWRNRYKSDFFPTKVPVNPPPLEQVGTGSSATLFSDFDEVLRKWITKDAEWKAYYRERGTHLRARCIGTATRSALPSLSLFISTRSRCLAVLLG